MEDIVWGDEIPCTAETKPTWLSGDQDVNAKWAGCEQWSSLGLGYKWVDVARTSGRISAIRLPADHWAYAPLAKGFTPWAGGDEVPVDAGEVMFRNGEINPESPLYRWEHASPDNTFAEGCDIIGYKPKAIDGWRAAPTYGPDDVVTIGVPAPKSFKAGDYVVASSENDEDLVGKIQILDKATEFSVYFNDGEHDRYRPTKYYRPATPEEIAAHKRANEDDAPKPYVLNTETIAAMREANARTYASVTELMDDLNDTVTIPKMTEEEASDLWWSYRDRCDTTASEDAIDMLRSLGIIRSATSIEAFEAHHGSGLSDEQMAAVRLYAEWTAAQ